MAQRVERCRGRRWAWVVSCVVIGGLYACSVWAQFAIPHLPGVYVGLGARTDVRIGFCWGGVQFATIHVPDPPTFPRPPMFWRIMCVGRPEWLPSWGYTSPGAAACLMLAVAVGGRRRKS